MKASLIFSVFIIPALFAARTPKSYEIVQAENNWYNAFIDCQSRGLQLATVKTCYDAKDLKAAIQAAGLNGTAWLSGTNAARSSQFVWMSTGQPFEYQKFAEGSPVSGANRNCVHVSVENGGKKVTWSNQVCSQQMYYICEPQPNNCAA